MADGKAPAVAGDGAEAAASGAAAEAASAAVEDVRGGPAAREGMAAAGAAATAATAWPPHAERLDAVAARLRALPRVEHPPVSARRAAVLVGLFADRAGVVRVLLTRRSPRLSSHRGEVCLPGGKCDEGDADDAATALREAHEELGLDPARVTPLGTLPPVLSKHHLSVTPVIALVPPDTVPAPNPAEVAAAFTVPLAVFLGDTTDPRVGASGATHGSVAQIAGTDGGDAAGRRVRRRSGGSREAGSARSLSTGGLPAAAGPLLSWSAAGVRSASRGRSAATAARSGRSRRGGGDAGDDAGEGHGSGGGGDGTGGVPIRDDSVYGSASHTFQDVTWGPHCYRIHSFQYGAFDVWGLTAGICIAAARVALGREPSFQELCERGQPYSAFYHDGTQVRVRQAVPPPLPMPGAVAPAEGAGAEADADGGGTGGAGGMTPVEAAAGGGGAAPDWARQLELGCEDAGAAAAAAAAATAGL